MADPVARIQERKAVTMVNLGAKPFIENAPKRDELVTVKNIPQVHAHFQLWKNQTSPDIWEALAKNPKVTFLEAVKNHVGKDFSNIKCHSFKINEHMA
eukprot:2405220-Karenia_brevis.AAC.1